MKFVPLQRLFLYPATELISRWDAQVDGARKSISLSDVIDNGIEIKYQLNPIIPYLDAVDQLLKRSNKGV